MTIRNGHPVEVRVATRTMPITEVKAGLLGLVTEVGDTGDEIIITRRGRPVAKLVPAATAHPLKGSLILPDDMAAYDLSAEWDASDLA
jgi:prevent-host-death family protein